MNSLFRCQLCCESRIEHENVSCAAMTTSNINPLLDIFIECRMWNEKERKLIFKHFYSSSHISSPFIRPTSSHEVTVPLLSPAQQENEKTFRTVVSHRVKTWITSTIFLYYCCACLYSFTYSFSHQVISTTPPQLKTQFLALLLHMHTQQLDGDEHRLFVIVSWLGAIFDPFFIPYIFSSRLRRLESTLNS